MEKISSPQEWGATLKNGENARNLQKMLSHQEELAERIIMGLRLTNGLPLINLRKTIPEKNIRQTLSEQKMQFLVDQDLLEKTDEKIKLTHLGMTKMNSVLEFLLAS
ncbi:MAG: hypothetical protein LBB29_02335 [Holosporaceae bacterium]|nr:hypothetical protein [Holosporaceae bacterium]